MKETKKKKVNKLLLIIVLFIGTLIGKKIYYEMTKDNLVLDELVKVEYEDTDSLFDGDSEYAWYKNINNYAYTIKEDNLTEEYYKYLQENNIKDRRWLIYDLIINDEYCHRKKAEELEECYISEGTVKFQNTENGRMQSRLGITIIESTDGEQAIYGTAKTEILMEGIDKAYIISQGPTVPGYEEAMEWSYRQYKVNDGQQSYAEFAERYYIEIEDDKDKLEDISNISLEKVVENYDDYNGVIGLVSTIINPIQS